MCLMIQNGLTDYGYTVHHVSMDTVDLIGSQEAAALLGMSHGGLTAAVRDGRIEPYARIGSRQTLVFDSAEIHAIAAKRRNSRGEAK